MAKKTNDKSSIGFNPEDCSNPKVYGPPKNGPKNVVKKMLERQKISILYGPPKEDSKEVRNKPGKKKK